MNSGISLACRKATITTTATSTKTKKKWKWNSNKCNINKSKYGTWHEQINTQFHDMPLFLLIPSQKRLINSSQPKPTKGFFWSTQTHSHNVAKSKHPHPWLYKQRNHLKVSIVHKTCPIVILGKGKQQILQTHILENPKSL
jgi:hypothetical protein